MTIDVVKRPWGEFRVLAENEPVTVKIVYIQPWEALSLQMHEHRDQYYVLIDDITLEWSDGAVPKDITNPLDILKWYATHWLSRVGQKGEEYSFSKREIHRASNHSDQVAKFFEVSYGHNDEDDIVRLVDRYGRATKG